MSFLTQCYLFLCFLGVMMRGLFSFFSGGLSNFLVLLFFCAPFLLLLLTKKIRCIYLNGLNKIIFAYILYIIGLVFFAESFLRGLIGLQIFTFYFSLYFFFILAPFSEEKFYERWDQIITMVFVILTMGAFYEIIFDNPLSTFVQFPTVGGMSKYFASFRLSSFIGSTLPFGVVYAYLTIFIATKLVIKKKLRYLTGLITALYVIFGSFNRSALGMSLFGIICVLCTQFIKWDENNKKIIFYVKPLVIYSISAIFAIIATIFILPASATQRVLDIGNFQESSNMIRFQHWFNVVDQIVSLRDLFLGVSLGASGNILSYFDLPSLLGHFKVTESYYLKLLLETGIIGLGLFLSMLLCALFYLDRLLSLPKTNKSPSFLVLRTYLFVSLLAQILQFAFLQSLESTSVAWMFFMNLGLTYTIYVREKPC